MDHITTTFTNETNTAADPISLARPASSLCSSPIRSRRSCALLAIARVRGFRFRLVARLLHESDGGVERALVVGDLPFGTYHESAEQAIRSSIRFVKEGGLLSWAGDRRWSADQPAIEVDMLRAQKEFHPIRHLKPVMDSEHLMKTQDTVRKIFVHESLMRYVQRLVAETRPRISNSLFLLPAELPSCGQLAFSPP